MADGSQRAFPFPRTPASRMRRGEIVVDLFAGGGAVAGAPDAGGGHGAVVGLAAAQRGAGFVSERFPLIPTRTLAAWLTPSSEMLASFSTLRREV